MELDDHAFLNELLAMRKEPWDVSFPTALGDLFSAEGGGSFDCCFDEPGPICGAAGGVFAPLPNATTATYGDVGETSGLTFGCYNPAEDCRADLEAEELGLVHGVHSHGPGGSGHVVCKVEELNQLSSLEGRGTINSNAAMAFPLAPFDGGSSSSSGPPEGKGRAKKLDGQPSKNLMAERRRRKRLNDRLSMLRSVVPKISKMDRTSILGDTIDYMKELLDRIQILREEMGEQGDGSYPSSEGLLRLLKNRLSHDEVLIRNAPKFDVERRETDTRVEMCCAARAGLLLSTVNSLEALGLEIEQCVVSCFNDFGMHASCSEDAKQRALISTEEIKQTLFRNAGYGGRCV